MSKGFSYKHILCVRADNMGDVLMSGPAIRALKEHFGAKITLLTSKLGSGIVPMLPEIDDVIVADLPWVKADATMPGHEYASLVSQLREFEPDLAVIFTVYSQSALPAALLCWQAGIPHRLAYCRENPYALLTHWVPDEEPYWLIRHQVERDLRLVREIGAIPHEDRLRVRVDDRARGRLRAVVDGFDLGGSLRIGGFGGSSCVGDLDGSSYIGGLADAIVLHPGVSEAKREYPLPLWIETARLLRQEMGCPLLITGGPKEIALAEAIYAGAGAAADAGTGTGTSCGNGSGNHAGPGVGAGVYNLAGKLKLDEFVALLASCRLIISVNTVTAHLAAAVQTPVIVLYALTNPQHTPWKVKSEVLTFSVPEGMRSHNQVIRYVSDLAPDHDPPPLPRDVLDAARRLLQVSSVAPEQTPFYLRP